MIRIDPVAVQGLAQGWLEQQEQLSAGCERLTSLPVSGFSNRVNGAARSFAEDWTDNVEAFAAETASIGERLGSVVTTYVETEHVVTDRFCSLDLNGSESTGEVR